MKLSKRHVRPNHKACNKDKHACVASKHPMRAPHRGRAGHQRWPADLYGAAWCLYTSCKLQNARCGPRRQAPHPDGNKTLDNDSRLGGGCFVSGGSGGDGRGDGGRKGDGAPCLHVRVPSLHVMYVTTEQSECSTLQTSVVAHAGLGHGGGGAGRGGLGDGGGLGGGRGGVGGRNCWSRRLGDTVDACDHNKTMPMRSLGSRMVCV